jgi:hypothetical protein
VESVFAFQSPLLLLGEGWDEVQLLAGCSLENPLFLSPKRGEHSFLHWNNPLLLQGEGRDEVYFIARYTLETPLQLSPKRGEN